MLCPYIPTFQCPYIPMRKGLPVMTYVSLVFRYIVDVLPLRAILRAWFSHPYLGMGLGLLSPQRASGRASYAAGRRAGARFREGVAIGSESAVERLVGCPGRGTPQRGFEASERLSGWSTRVVPGEPANRQASDTTKARSRQEVNPKRDKFLNLLTGIKIRCYNSRFSGNGHIRHIPYVRFITIYQDLWAYNRQNGQIRHNGHLGLIRQNRQFGNVGYFRPYTTLYHQFPSWAASLTRPSPPFPYTNQFSYCLQEGPYRGVFCENAFYGTQ